MNFNSPSKLIFKKKKREGEKERKRKRDLSRREEKLKNSISNLLREIFFAASFMPPNISNYILFISKERIDSYFQVKFVLK